MNNIEFQIIKSNESQTIQLIADWYLSEWNIPIEKTAQKINSFEEDGSQCQVLMLANGIPVSTGGLYAQVGLHSKEPRFGIYKNWLAQVYTIPSMRHKGLGALICNYIQDISIANGAKEMYLFTDTAENLYTRLGWTPLERLLYGHRNIVVMKKQL